MKQRSRLWLGILTVIVVAAAPGKAVAGPSSDNLLELAARGGPSVSLGFGVSPLHWELIAPLPVIPGSAPAEGRTLGDREPRGRAVSLDFKLKWPGAEVPIEPYVVLGPALFVEQPHDPSDLMGTPADPIVRLGAKAGAGFNWRLTKDATLFGSYDVTTTGVDAFSSARTKAPATGVPTEYELLYGVRFRY
jgi:hypothetical protein